MKINPTPIILCLLLVVLAVMTSSVIPIYVAIGLLLVGAVVK